MLKQEHSCFRTDKRVYYFCSELKLEKRNACSTVLYLWTGSVIYSIIRKAVNSARLSFSGYSKIDIRKSEGDGEDDGGKKEEGRWRDRRQKDS